MMNRYATSTTTNRGYNNNNNNNNNNGSSSNHQKTTPTGASSHTPTLVFQSSEQLPDARSGGQHLQKEQGSNNHDTVLLLQEQINGLRQELQAQSDRNFDLQASLLAVEAETGHQVQRLEEETKRKVSRLEENLRRAQQEANLARASLLKKRQQQQQQQQQVMPSSQAVTPATTVVAVSNKKQRRSPVKMQRLTTTPESNSQKQSPTLANQKSMPSSTPTPSGQELAQQLLFFQQTSSIHPTVLHFLTQVNHSMTVADILWFLIEQCCRRGLRLRQDDPPSITTTPTTTTSTWKLLEKAFLFSNRATASIIHACFPPNTINQQSTIRWNGRHHFKNPTTHNHQQQQQITNTTPKQKELFDQLLTSLQTLILHPNSGGGDEDLLQQTALSILQILMTEMMVLDGPILQNVIIVQISEQVLLVLEECTRQILISTGIPWIRSYPPFVSTLAGPQEKQKQTQKQRPSSVKHDHLDKIIPRICHILQPILLLHKKILPKTLQMAIMANASDQIEHGLLHHPSKYAYLRGWIPFFQSWICHPKDISLRISFSLVPFLKPKGPSLTTTKRTTQLAPSVLGLFSLLLPSSSATTQTMLMEFWLDWWKFIIRNDQHETLLSVLEYKDFFMAGLSQLLLFEDSSPQNVEDSKRLLQEIIYCEEEAFAIAEQQWKKQQQQQASSS